MSFEVVIHTDKCQGCGNCVVICPPNADISPESGVGFGPRRDQVLLKVLKGQITVINVELCNGCGACMLVCPTNAIEIVPLTPTSAEAVFTVGEAAQEAKKEAGIEVRNIKPEELPQLENDVVEQIKGGIGAVSETLKTIKLRYFIELGRLSSAEEEISGRLRRQLMAMKMQKKKPEEDREDRKKS